MAYVHLILTYGQMIHTLGLPIHEIKEHTCKKEEERGMLSVMRFHDVEVNSTDTDGSDFGES